MEEWKNIAGFENYEVSNYGNIRSKDRISIRRGHEVSLKGKLLKPRFFGGYLRVTLYGGSRENVGYFAVHRLVANAFIPNNDNLPFINHIDENKTNNHADNLEWCTAKYNSNYGTSIARRVSHQNWQDIADKQSKPVIQYDLNGNEVARFKSTMDAERKGYKSAGVCKCANGKLKTYRGCIWKYEGEQ